MTAKTIEDLPGLLRNAKPGDTIDTKDLFAQLQKELEQANPETLSELATFPHSGSLFTSTTTDASQVFKKMETRLFPEMKEPDPVQLLNTLMKVLQGDMFKDRDWVLFSYGTFLTFDKSEDTESELLERARHVMTEHGPIFVATQSADYGAIPLKNCFPSNDIWLAYYCFGKEMCNLVFGTGDTTNMTAGLQGRQGRQEDAEKQVILAYSKAV